MRIVHLAYSNAAGVPGRWAEAHRKAGIDVTLVLEVDDVYQYGSEAQVERWSSGRQEPAEMMDQVVGNADAVMVYDSPFYLEAAIELGKPVLFRAMGSHSRREPERVRELLQSLVVKRATAGTGDLALALNVNMKGAPFPVLPTADPKEGLAVHSPSNPPLKGTQVIEDVAKETGWDLEVVTDVSHEEVLMKKRRASLVIDQFGDPPHPDGMGVAGVEALAMGLPVVSRASLPVQGLYHFVGCPTVFVETRDELRTMLSWLRMDEDVRESLGAAGQEWVGDFHNAEARVAEDLAVL